MTNKYILAIALLWTLSSCAQVPLQNSDYCTTVIPVGNGPEDLIIDTITDRNQPRLLIACNSRRKAEAPLSEIYSYEINSKRIIRLKRSEPANLCFNPHGIDLVMANDSLILLVVNHCREQKENSIIRYYVTKDSLIFLNKITDPLFVSPNAVAGFADGSFLVSNDAGKHGDIFEMLFKQKKSKVIYYKDGKGSVAADKICFGNGILIKGETVYQGSTLPGEVYEYRFKDGKLLDRKTIATIKGADNIRLQDSVLVVAGHLEFGKFLKHMKKSEYKSPSAIYTINRVTKETKLLYYNSGEAISTASTGLIYRDKLYISQIFDAFILEVDLHCHKLK